MSERELIRITYDEDSGWTITYPHTGKWVENVDITKMNDAIHIVDTFVKGCEEILKEKKE